MAEAAVSFVLSKLDVALNHAVELRNLSDQLEPMQRELRLIQCFLRDADSKRNRNALIKQWVKEVREVACRIEDWVDTFLVEIEIERNRPVSSGSGFISTLLRFGKNSSNRSGLCDEIKKIRETLMAIYDRKTYLGISDVGASSEESSLVPFRPSKLSEIDVSEIVGLESEKCQIIGQLLDPRILRRTVISIVGIGGLGKTTLAKKVYQSAELKGQFQCRTWLSISQKFNITNVLREILYSIEHQIQKRKRGVSDDELPIEINRSLNKKRYLIVLDDVWTMDLWDRLKLALPDMKNGSRVLITSRSLEVARAADSETLLYKLPYLTEEESLTLLLRKALPHEQPDNYPFDLIKVAKQLTKKCGGLPLALIVLGGVLSRRERNYTAWHNVEQTMDWHNEDGEKCSRILALSYEDLPYHLKPCFLYFASFPEDYKISQKHVTKMWIAEGFVSNDGVGTLEDRAAIYFEEITQRCLVQVIEKSWNGYCKYCVVHDLLRDLAIHEAKEDNFFAVLSKAEDGRLVDAKRVRRAAVQYCTPIKNDIYSTKIRSLLFFGQFISNYKGFKLLRVLTIERADTSVTKVAYERWLEGLIHLRYLGFRYCLKLPHGFGRVSFSSLKNLETLDFKGTNLNDRPDDSVWEVTTLRHVISPFGTPFICNPSKLDHLQNLQTLKWVTFQNFPQQGCDLKLRKIGFCLDTDFWRQCGPVEQARDMLKGLLKRMNLLVSLSVRSNGYAPFPFGDTSDLPCYEMIQCLFLDRVWPHGVVLSAEMFPTNLTKLTLIGSMIEQHPMFVLERMQSLRVLQLNGLAYMGTELVCSTGGFPSLQKLELSELRNLRYWTINEGAMPMLSQLQIRRCDQLLRLPELHRVPTLQHLIVHNCSSALHESMQSDELHEIRHIPFVRHER